MCDCAEEKRRLIEEAEKNRVPKEPATPARYVDSRGSGPPRDFGTKELLGLLGALFLILGLLYRNLSRKTTRWILTLLGLGWLMPKRPYCDPCPQLVANKVRFPDPVCSTQPHPSKKECTCDSR